MILMIMAQFYNDQINKSINQSLNNLGSIDYQMKIFILHEFDNYISTKVIISFGLFKKKANESIVFPKLQEEYKKIVDYQDDLNRKKIEKSLNEVEPHINTYYNLYQTNNEIYLFNQKYIEVSFNLYLQMCNKYKGDIYDYSRLL